MFFYISVIFYETNLYGCHIEFFLLVFNFCSSLLIVPHILFPIFLSCCETVTVAVANFIVQKTVEAFGTR